MESRRIVDIPSVLTAAKSSLAPPQKATVAKSQSCSFTISGAVSNAATDNVAMPSSFMTAKPLPTAAPTEAAPVSTVATSFTSQPLAQVRSEQGRSARSSSTAVASGMLEQAATQLQTGKSQTSTGLQSFAEPERSQSGNLPPIFNGTQAAPFKAAVPANLTTEILDHSPRPNLPVSPRSKPIPVSTSLPSDQAPSKIQPFKPQVPASPRTSIQMAQMAPTLDPATATITVQPFPTRSDGPDSPALPRVKEAQFSNHRNSTKPCFAMSLLNDIATVVENWQTELNALHQQIQHIYIDGPIVDGWLEAITHTEGWVQGYRLCGLDAAGRLWTRPCQPEQIPELSLAIARYQHLRQLLAQKQSSELRLQQLGETLSVLRGRL